MPARLFLDHPLHTTSALTLPPGPARHVQVLRLQPGAEITLFNGQGGEWRATVAHMGRSEVQVQVHEHMAVDRELAQPITLAVGMPANERMDALVEKATELGVAAIQPLLTERSVLRLSGERAERRLAHWQGVAIAASVHPTVAASAPRVSAKSRSLRSTASSILATSMRALS